MDQTQGALVLLIVLLTNQYEVSDAAAGNWTHPVISNATNSGIIAMGETSRIGYTYEYVAVEGATSYRIVSQPVDGLFALQANGSLGITSRLDYENRTSYAIVIEASIGDSMKSTATVTVRVEDKNDNAPVFHGSPYFIELPDNSIEGTFVVKATATDDDRSFYMGKIDKYAIKPGKDNDSFFIVETSGDIYVGKDRQLSSTVKTNYTFIVMATDTGVPYRTGSADVTVCVANCPRMGNGGQSLVAVVWGTFLMVVCAFHTN